MPNVGSLRRPERKEREAVKGMKGGQASRPKLLSPIQKRKKTERKDLVVAGSLLRKGH